MISQQLNLITLQDAMDLMKVSRSTVDRWRRYKRLPYIKIGKEIYFNKEDFENWIKSHTYVEEKEFDSSYLTSNRR
ncbi:helix-turn-helix domain-containing protein [Paenibacillus abyssi]|uniref:Helix-turn-helix domain-containing protein n=1 Tax=Paenibacillus abyssi TaxID=1340531 RepID=A0A917CNE6_9BACL|nr:helix-turn-helix domain-containing protein [Paenibacillus abyssi]GGF93427.1 hypothetical protein GCM10010916_08520 [Paenibacillus abyssi]